MVRTDRWGEPLRDIRGRTDGRLGLFLSAGIDDGVMTVGG
jgi:hypothetical protein